MTGETRYTSQMNSITSLPPHLEQFVREQIAAGHFHSEGDVIRAALRLLEASAAADRFPRPRSGETVAGTSDRPAIERWEMLRGPQAEGRGVGQPPLPVRRSLRGLLADIPSDLSFDDFKEARSESWAGLRPGGAG